VHQETIKSRAYELWKAAGEPEGKMDVFWYEAGRQLLEERAKMEACPRPA
jgi:hypothetical protein